MNVIIAQQVEDSETFSGASDDAIQGLLDYFDSLEESVSMEDVGNSGDLIMDSLENDLRVWWGDGYNYEGEDWEFLWEEELFEEEVEEEVAEEVAEEDAEEDAEEVAEEVVESVESAAVELGPRFTYFSEPMTWPDALDFCRGLGGDLASIHNAEERDEIHALDDLSGGYWIGLNDLETEGEYVWTDGSPFDYINWRDNMPNQRDPDFDNVDVHCVKQRNED